MYIYLSVSIFLPAWTNADAAAFGKTGPSYFSKIHRNLCNRYIVDNYAEKNLLDITFKFHIYLKNNAHLHLSSPQIYLKFFLQVDMLSFSDVAVSVG